MTKTKAFISIALLVGLSSTYAQNPIYSSSTSTYLEGSHFHRIISLTPNLDSKSDCPLIGQEVNEKDGYYMEIEKSYSGSFMSSHSWWFPEQTQWAVAGLGPTASRYVMFMGTALGEDAIKNFKKKKIPLRKDELDEWQKGDAVFWNSEGGVAVGLGTGISPFHIGTKYTVKGSWAHYVEKTGPNKVFVSLINRRVQSISVSGGILYLGGGVDSIKEKIKSRSYEIEIVDEAHEIAYRKFLKGDEDALIELIDNGSENVTPIEVIESKKMARELAAGMANPIFPVLSWRVSNSSSRQMEHGEASWGTVRDKFWGVYSWQAKYRAIVLDFRKYKQFMAGTQLAKQPNYDNGGFDDVQTYFGSLEYIFEADHGREGRVNNQFDNFIETTGLHQYCINVPDIESTLRYHNINHKIDFSGSFIKRLIESSKQGLVESAMQAKSGEIILKMINENQKAACGKSDIEKCSAKLANQADKAIASLAKELEDLGQTQLNSLDMGKAFSLVGRKVSSNPLLYRLFYEEGKKCGMDVHFEVSGRKLTRMVKTESFEESLNCF
tara:strand:+ start:27817 stop:29472 length:1656 start_codon:yes stop_codon:yes gene_type:complete